MPIILKLYNIIHGRFQNKFPKLYCFCAPKKSIIKFLIAGSIAGSTDLILLFIFHGVIGWHIVPSTSLAFLFSFLISFYLQKKWTFKENYTKKGSKQFILYFLNAFLSLNINGLAMHLLVNEWNILYLLAQIIVNLVLGSLNYIIYKTIIFRNDQEDEINCE